MEEKNFMYDEMSDRLFISCKKDDDIVYGSVRVFNIALDFTTDDRIVNVEIKNVSEYLEELSINPDTLKNLKNVKLVSKKYREGYLLYFILETQQGIMERVPFNIPMEQTISV